MLFAPEDIESDLLFTSLASKTSSQTSYLHCFLHVSAVERAGGEKEEGGRRKGLERVASPLSARVYGTARSRSWRTVRPAAPKGPRVLHQPSTSGDVPSAENPRSAAEVARQIRCPSSSTPRTATCTERVGSGARFPRRLINTSRGETHHTQHEYG